jgi:hypothetical protein
MKASLLPSRRRGCALQALLLIALTALTPVLPDCHARVLDDFNDNSKTAWTDFTFVPGVGLPVEQNGQFAFAIPGAAIGGAGSSLFSASTKSSETFTLQEGRTVEFRVDVIQAGAGHSYAILGFVPTSAGGPGQLKGYSLVKSTTDVIVAKGINQYFIDDDTATGQIKNDNITLVLSMTVKNGNVILIAKVLDKAAQNAVLWEQTFVDTPTADVMGSGTDNPPAPWLGTGNFALYLYADNGALEDPYQVTYDNAEVYVDDTAILDDFNDNTKSAWTDFTFVPGVGIPAEQNGRFAFAIPGAVGQSIFSASTKTSRGFDLVEGERIAFSVDVISGGAKDSFAVLSFIPTSSGGPGQLKGYSLAKSTTDVLMVKGINQYFVADAGAAANLKQDNITLVLSLTVKNGSVILEAEVLDKDDNNKVIWDRTVVDTPAADVMAKGSDSPPAPFLGSGNFVLYLYADYDAAAVEDPYQVVYDNAVVSAPPVAANTAPIISETQPADFANFLPASTQISFKVADDKALQDGKLSVLLNGTNYTTTNGLAVTGTGSTKTATLGGLAANANYAAVVRAEDSEGLKAEHTLYFDTFLAGNLAIEIEDYNFGGGQSIDNPVPVAEGNFQANGYSLQTAVADIDYSDTRATPNGTETMYRPDDSIRMAHTRDNVRAKYTAAGGTGAGVYDYDVGDIATGEWLNYTRTFPAGSYEVYLREALANMPSGESVLEQVTGNPSQTGQTTKILGSFLGGLTGFQYRNFALTDGTGLNKVILRLSGRTTLRLRQVTPDPGDGLRLQNYLMFVSVPDPGVQRATVGSVSPAADSTVETVAPSIQVVIQNRDTSVNTNTVKLELNGAQVPATVTPTASGADIAYVLTPLPASGATNHAVVTFKDNLDADVSTEWFFVVSYKSLDPALRVAGTGQDRNLNVRVVQQEQGVNTQNSLAWAESLLVPGTALVKLFDTNVVAPVINYSQNAPDATDGYFTADAVIPGTTESGANDDLALEITTYLDLPAGVYRFGARCDDGYKVQVVSDFTDRGAAALAFHNGGPADETYDFVVTASGLYRFRMVWYERGGGAHVEWFSADFAASPTRTLINDPATSSAIKAYRSVLAPSVVLQSSATLASGSFAPESAAAVDTNAKTVTVARSGDRRFYRLSSGTALHIKGIQFQGQNVVLTYE